MKHVQLYASFCIFHRYCRTVACGQPGFPETKSGQAENDIVSLASSFLMVQVFRFGFTGGRGSVVIRWLKGHMGQFPVESGRVY